MPELPEVESVRRSLVPHLVGRHLSAVRVKRRDVIYGQSTPTALLASSSVVELRRRGKQLAIITDSGRCVVVHLGMTGQLMTLPAARIRELTHVHVVWTVASGCVLDQPALIFRDPRRFGGLWPLASIAQLESRWTDLGPDSLDISSEDLASQIGGSRRAIKAALLDQRVLAGVGNIYADEALFTAGIAPTRRASSLKPTELDALAAALRATLAASIVAGGSTLRDFVNGRGEPGSYRTRHAVYGRAGEPCLRCSTRLHSRQLAQRTTVWCPKCQAGRGTPRAC